MGRTALDEVLTEDSPLAIRRHILEGAPHPGRAIVTYGRSLISLVIARSLHEKGVEVIGCDDIGMTVLSFSKHVEKNFVHTPFEDDLDKALDELEAKVREYAPDDDRPYVLIPGFRDAKILAQHRDRFEPLIRIAAPEEESIGLIDPKDAFARFLEEHDLPGPVTQILEAGEDRSGVSERVVYPLIVKPNDGVGGRGVEKIDSPEEMDRYLAEAPEDGVLLLQDLVDGEDYCVSFVALRGELLGVVAYRNIAQFPKKAGAGAVRETVDAAPFMEATRKLVKATRWNGVAEIDFRWDGADTSTPKMLEVNPRYWAGLFHSTESGVDFPWIAYRIAAGLPVTHPDQDSIEIGFRSRTPGAWILSAAEEVASSDAHLQRSSDAWDKVKAHISRGEVISAVRKVLDTAAVTTKSPEILARLKGEMDKYKDMPSELTSDKDPAVGLGVMFALSSLIRHGRLPPELKFDAPEEVETEPDPEEAARQERTEVAREVRQRPVIGITKPSNGDWLSWMAMSFAVWLAGGKPVKITSRAPRDPHSIDGLVFGGGADVFPERYQGEAKADYTYDKARDDMEMSWAKAALDNEIPVLGVCRGMQMLNVFAGGTLHHDLSDFEGSASPETFFRRIFYRKPIRITMGSRLDRASTREVECVNSIHTQAVARLGEGFTITAREPNSLAQAIEHERAPFMMGVQFHPEFLIYRKFARNIFKDLVDTARWRAAMRVHGG